MEQEKQVKYILIVMVLSLLLLGGSLVIYREIKLSQNNFNYNGFEVYRQKELNSYNYKVQLFLGNNPQPLLINIREDPRKLESIPIESNIKSKIIDGKNESFITMSENATSLSVIAAAEISKIIGNRYFFNLPTHGALISLPKGKNNLTIKTCEDVSKTTSIIYLKIANQTKIYSEDDCIIIEAQTENDLIKAATRLSLTLIGVMKE